jgi:iron(III) transport system permease protein
VGRAARGHDQRGPEIPGNLDEDHEGPILSSLAGNIGKPQRQRTSLLRWFLLVLVIFFAGAPVLALLYGSVRGPNGFTGEYLRRVFLSGVYLQPLIGTLELAAVSGLLATLIGGILATVMSRVRLPAPSFLELGIMAPLFISPFIGVIGWITLAQPGAGMLNVLLVRLGVPQLDIFSFTGTSSVIAIYFAPYSYALIKNAMDRLNPEMEEAAAVSGATWFGTAMRVTLPMLLPSVISALIFSFVLSAEIFSIPGILLVPQGYDFLSYSIFVQSTRYPLDYSQAAAAGVLLLLLTMFGMGLYSWTVRLQERFISIGPKAPRHQPVALPAGLCYGAFAAVVIYVLCSVALPIAAIALRSLLPYFSGEFNWSELSLSNLQSTLSDPLVLDSLRNSIVVTVVATAALIVLAFFVALGRVRHHDKLSSLTAFVAGIPVAVPGVLFGVGLLWLYIRTPLYATLGIIILVMLARFLPMLVRMFETALIQLGRELDEAAAVCGASERVINVKIRLPLLLGTLRSAVTVGGAQVFNELTASALLYTSSSSVLPVVVFNYMFDGDYSRAAALALLQIVVLTVGFVINSVVLGLAAPARQ